MENKQPRSIQQIPLDSSVAPRQTSKYTEFRDSRSKDSSNRLVVIVPEGKVDNSRLAQKIWRLASLNRLSVLYVGCVNEPATSLAVTRQMVTLAAITRDPQVSVGYRLITGPDWSAALKTLLLPGDEIAVLEEHFISKGWFKQIHFSQTLQSLNTPVQVISGILIPEKAVWKWITSPLIHHVALWIVLIATFFGFYEFDLIIDSSLKGWPAILISVLLVSLEIGIIWFWNSILG
jgi:hypothetical protein